MKKVTITLDEDVARWARMRAAEKDTSLSRLVDEMLREKMREENDYQAAMRLYFSLPAQPLGKPGQKYPKREELYERKGIG